MFRWLLEIRTSTLNGLSVLQVSFYFNIHIHTSWNGNKRNSSVLITSWKFSRANLWDRLWSSLQAWVSAKFLMPRQFVGCSWRMRNLQHASLTELIWRMEEAGSRTCGKNLISSSKQIWEEGKVSFLIIVSLYVIRRVSGSPEHCPRILRVPRCRRS